MTFRFKPDDFIVDPVEYEILRLNICADKENEYRIAIVIDVEDIFLQKKIGYITKYNIDSLSPYMKDVVGSILSTVPVNYNLGTGVKFIDQNYIDLILSEKAKQLSYSLFNDIGFFSIAEVNYILHITVIYPYVTDQYYLENVQIRYELLDINNGEIIATCLLKYSGKT